jgi:hypothetical protein
MSFSGTESNGGLCGKLTAQQIEAMQAAGIGGPEMRITGLAVGRCALCVFARRTTILNEEVVGDTGLGDVANQELRELVTVGAIKEVYPDDLPLEMDLLGMHQYVPSDQTAELAQVIPAPDCCPRRSDEELFFS